MCLLIVKPSGQKAPGLTALKNAERSNPHGIGVAQWRKRWNHVLIKKDFRNAEHLDQWLKKNTNESDALIIHFRYATSGLVDEGNRHPFPVTANVDAMRKVYGRAPLVVAHNGVFSQFRGNSTESDTMEFIRTVLAGAVCRTLKDQGTKALLKDYLRGQRVAFLDRSGEITLFGDFHIKAGCHYSNHTYESPKYITTVWDDEEKGDWGKPAFIRHWSPAGYKAGTTYTAPKLGKTGPGEVFPLHKTVKGTPLLDGARYNELTNCDMCGKFTATKQHVTLGGYLCQTCDDQMERGK